MLSLRNISKTFPGVNALTDVSIEFMPGEVHAICGENGAGKSTLMNIIMGNLQANTGAIAIDEQEVQINNVLEAQRRGISIVYQEGSLSDALSVAENIFPNRQPQTKLGLIDFEELYRRSSSLLRDLEIDDIKPSASVSNLSTQQKKLVEIAKALAHRPSYLILDEPTASLTHEKVALLFNIISRLKEKRVTIIYISHRMDEIMKLADRITILKDGVVQDTLAAKSATIDTVIKMMVGREILPVTVNRNLHNDRNKLEVRKLSGKDFHDVSFKLHEGEIFGLAGLQGSGRSGLLQTLFGDLQPISGSILKDERHISPQHPSDAISLKIAYVPEDRKESGLFLNLTINENVSVTRLRGTWYNKKKNQAATEKLVRHFGIRAVSGEQAVNKLSGGNQQKVVLAKWFEKDPDVMLVNEPTHGVDVGAKQDIYKLLRAQADEGKSIIVVSSELPELLFLCDRIGVMYMGRLTKIFNRNEASEEAITAAASGL